MFDFNTCDPELVRGQMKTQNKGVACYLPSISYSLCARKRRPAANRVTNPFEVLRGREFVPQRGALVAICCRPESRAAPTRHARTVRG